MTNERDSTNHAFTLVRQWRVGSEPEAGVVGVEFIDATGELHSYCFSPAVARALSISLTAQAERVEAPITGNA